MDKIKIILSGCNGKMGKAIALCAESREDIKIIAGVDLNTENDYKFPVYDSFEGITETAQVIIDFSHPAVLENMLKYACINKIPCVICTTGYSSLQIEKIKNAAETIPIFYSGNMSLGINLMIELSKIAAKVLGKNFDIEIIEKHHNQKLDAPSGTALMIADGISSVLKKEPLYVYDRHSVRKKRSQNEIGIHSIRGGTIVGEHQAIFAGMDEVLTITHMAQSKAVFASGALNAAVYLSYKENGLFDMNDLINDH